MRPKTAKILYWAITILFVLFIGFGAVGELMQTESAKKVLTDLGYPVYLNYILGIAKVIGCIALLQWTYKTVKEWAYAGFTIDIIGAGASTYFATGSVFFTLFTLVFLIPLFLSYWLWKKSGEPTKA